MQKRAWVGCALLVSFGMAGCGPKAEEKKFPTVTPEQQAVLDKAHQQQQQHSGTPPATPAP